MTLPFSFHSENSDKIGKDKASKNSEIERKRSDERIEILKRQIASRDNIIFYEDHSTDAAAGINDLDCIERRKEELDKTVRDAGYLLDRLDKERSFNLSEIKFYSERLCDLWGQYIKTINLGFLIAGGTFLTISQTLLRNDGSTMLAHRDYAVFSLVLTGISAISLVMWRWATQALMERQAYGRADVANKYFEITETDKPAALVMGPGSLSLTYKFNDIMKYLGFSSILVSWLFGLMFYGYSFNYSYKEGDMRRYDMKGALLVDYDFSGSNLSWVNFHRADLRGAVFFGANMTGTDFSGADLSGIKTGALRNPEFSAHLWALIEQPMREDNTSYRSFWKGVLAGIRINDIPETGKASDFSKAIFRGANLTDADLSGSNLRQDDLVGACGARIKFKDETRDISRCPDDWRQRFDDERWKVASGKPQ